MREKRRCNYENEARRRSKMTPQQIEEAQRRNREEMRIRTAQINSERSTKSRRTSENQASVTDQAANASDSVPKPYGEPPYIAVSTTDTFWMAAIVNTSLSQQLPSLHGLQPFYQYQTNHSPSIHQTGVTNLNSIPFLSTSNNHFLQQIPFQPAIPLQHQFQNVELLSLHQITPTNPIFVRSPIFISYTLLQQAMALSSA